MIDVYAIGATLKLNDLVAPQLLKLSREFAKIEAVALRVNKSLQAMGAEVASVRGLAGAAKSLGGSLRLIKDEAALAEKNLVGLRAALAAPGSLGIEAELIAANHQARTLAATMAGIRGGGRIPPLIPPVPGQGGGGRHGGRIHGGNLHFGSNGVGVGGVGIGLMSDALLPLGGAMVAGYVGKKFYESAKDYQDEFMRFKSLNLGDKVNAEADSFVKATRTFGVSQSELMKAMAESVGLFGSFEEASKYTPALVTLGKANNAIFGDKLGAMDDEGLKNLLKFIDRRGGFKDEASFNRNLNLAEKLVTGSGGFLHFQDLGSFSQQGGTAFRSLSDEGLLHMEGLMMEQGGSKAATSMMSIYQNLVAGRTPKKTMGLLQDLGLAQLQMQEHGSIGGKPMKSLVMTSIAGSDLLQTDPAKWMNDVLLPALAKKGITSQDQVLKAVNDVLSNRNASNQGSIMTTQQFQLVRDYNLAKGAMGSKQVIDMFKPSASGAESDFDAAWADFKKQFGTTMLPQITNMLKAGADLLRSLGSVADSPAFKAIQSFSGDAAHAFAWPYRLMFGNANAAEPQSNGAHGSPFVQPKQQTINLNSKVFIDQRQIGEAAASYLVDGMNRPQSTNSGTDFSRSVPPIGNNYAR